MQCGELRCAPNEALLLGHVLVCDRVVADDVFTLAGAHSPRPQVDKVSVCNRRWCLEGGTDSANEAASLQNNITFVSSNDKGAPWHYSSQPHSADRAAG